MSEVRINVEHLTRVEGHGNIILNARDGKVEKVEWQVSEAPRFFESFVRGREYSEVSKITSRICGICSIAHSLSSLKATEDAMGIKISPQTEDMRLLALHGENMQSHILHIGYLVAPDLLHTGSVLPLISSAPDALRNIIKLHRLANEMSDLICGRTTHPITFIPGGFTQIPSEKQLLALREKLVNIMPICDTVATLLKKNIGVLPNFERETEYVGLVNGKNYALYDGMIGSSDTGEHDIHEYRNITNEFVVPQSTAKYTKHARDSYFVGALPRYNLNHEFLHEHASEWAAQFGLEPPLHNPFQNTIVQMVEYIHSLEDSIELIDKCLSRGLDHDDRSDYDVRAGHGVGIVEAPRGLLIHDYTYDDQGICTKANCIIPTNQNHGNIQKDFEKFAPSILNKPEKEIELNMEMLVRAYDPCISCSTHYMKVEFRK